MGGQHVFLREAYGPAWGAFCSAGRCCSSIQKGTIAALAVAFANFVGALSGIGYLIVLTGIPAYFIWRKRTRPADSNDR